MRCTAPTAVSCLIKGEEVTDRFDESRCTSTASTSRSASSPRAGRRSSTCCSATSTRSAQARGVPHINHPNFGWAITTDELQQVQNNELFEIYNGHPQVNNLGGGGVPGLEEAWDAILSSGTLLYGIAVDDAHTFKQPGNPAVAGPGRGWVMVRAEPARMRAPSWRARDWDSSTPPPVSS